MNEIQHQAKITRDRAMTEYKAAKQTADDLGKVLVEADLALQQAITQDPASWYSTPGILT